MSTTSRERVFERSGGRCEVLVRVGDVWTRCGRMASDVHHLLPRSRGGDVLDDEGEVYHLINLDRHHHNQIHGSPADAYRTGLTIDGQVYIDGTRVVYRGTDTYLSERYQ